MKPTAVVAIAMILLSGCTSGGSPMSTPSTPASSSSGSTGDVSAQRWAAIIADLAARGVATDAVQLVSAKSVTWNDGSLGCPKPGQSYTQALVSGMQVVVSVDAKEYDYRFGASDRPKLCDRTVKARGIHQR